MFRIEVSNRRREDVSPGARSPNFGDNNLLSVAHTSKFKQQRALAHARLAFDEQHSGGSRVAAAVLQLLHKRG
jgi:hypothetical protein